MTNSAKKTVGGKDADDRMIDDLLAEAAGFEIAPDNDLMARVLSDAALVQQQRLTKPKAVRLSIWVQLGQMMGGWPAFGGLVAAGVAGLWIGVAPPASLETFAAEVLGTTESVNLLGSSFDSVFEDGFDG